MNTTINISLPKEMYKDVKSAVKGMRYSSVSELIRDALRDKIYSNKKNSYTINGFTPEFEEQVLLAEKETTENDILLKTEEDIDKHYNQIINDIKKDKYN